MIKMVLGNPKKTMNIIQKHNFSFQKRYGQNFLIDSNILEKIIGAAEIKKDDFVIEIGPGIGTLTQYLCNYAKEVLAIEIDRELIPILEETLSHYSNCTIWNKDILKVDLQREVEEKNKGSQVKVVANLPYYITTPIIMELLESNIPLESITIMVQKEVAERMQVGPGSKEYGALSLAVQYYAKPQIITYVSPFCFMPRPKVGSAVIHLKKYSKPPIKVEDEKLMFQLIKASFNQRRKTLANGLKNGQGIKYSKEEIEKAISALGLPLTIRGENLALEQFAQLTNLLIQGQYNCF